MQPLGVSYSGASYKFTVLDTLGRRVAQQCKPSDPEGMPRADYLAAQLPQVGYHALNTPYSFIGLGRTNNYVEVRLDALFP
jgi:integrin alpha FG-GAP repeat containing protein 1